MSQSELAVRFGIFLQCLRRERRSGPRADAPLTDLAAKALAREAAGDWMGAEAALYDLAQAAFTSLAHRTAGMGAYQGVRADGGSAGEMPLLSMDEQEELDLLTEGLAEAFCAYEAPFAAEAAG